MEAGGCSSTSLSIRGQQCGIFHFGQAGDEQPYAFCIQLLYDLEGTHAEHFAWLEANDLGVEQRLYSQVGVKKLKEVHHTGLPKANEERAKRKRPRTHQGLGMKIGL